MIFADVFRGDFSYDLLLLVHVLAVIVGFGPTFIFPILSSQTLLPHIGPAVLRISTFVVTPSIVLAGITGIGLSLIGPFDFGEAWVTIAVLVFLGSLVFAFRGQCAQCQAARGRRDRGWRLRHGIHGHDEVERDPAPGVRRAAHPDGVQARFVGQLVVDSARPGWHGDAVRGGQLARVFMVGAIAAGGLLLFAVPASASLSGPCDGQGTFRSDGQVVNASTANKVTVAEQDTVDYEGRINTSDTGRSHNGAIELDLPFPLPNVAVADWSTNSTDANEDIGTYEYELPWYVPRGVEIPLEGFHNDTAGNCKGSVTIEIAGGPLDSPAAIAAALLGTVFSGLGVFAAAKAKP